MRIIGGKYKGLSLSSFKADHIRPTTDRVKESLFNILRNEVPEALVADLFAGTGNLGIEALSRGAAKVIFVEINKKSQSILEENLRKLQVSEPYQIVRKDVLAFLKAYQGEPFQVIFVDPPFTEQMADQVVEALSRSQAVGDYTLIAIESAKREKLEDQYGNLTRFDKREFGDKILSFFKRTP